ncbi:hypothetical protein EOD41_10780 [Mucilaginibacter limnophilus]|uniref:Uncharacterized protein n=1 Tax=Mucilaginibacter limnophilus TaxID=1932778 RepID=A0A437MU16_9SPHI|nr:hypothetical protein [Mucilaginibacter limnophilus]RVU01090.1 hypothetical protein EOD41_10780 [Mucilaginibacter limnophilus]
MLPAYDPDNNIGAVDRVRFAMMHNRMEALHADEREQYNRWCQIDDWFRSKRFVNDQGKEEVVVGRRKIRNLVMVKYKVSWDTAERAIQNAIKLFTPADDEKEYKRSVYLEDLEQKAEEAAGAGEYGAYASIMKLAGDWRKFDKEPVEEQLDKFQAFQFIIEYNPEAIGLKTIENKDQIFARWQKRKATEKMALDAEEVEYDDI